MTHPMIELMQGPLDRNVEGEAPKRQTPDFFACQKNYEYIAVGVLDSLYITDDIYSEEYDALLRTIAYAHGSQRRQALSLDPDDLENMYLDLDLSGMEPKLIQFP